MCVVVLPQKYCPAAADLPTTNGPWATGDGVELGSGLGAALVGMEHVQVSVDCVFSALLNGHILQRTLASANLRAW